MVLGSHNAWSYSWPRKWYMLPFRFVARCQDYDIKGQYEKCSSRCFDLRVRFNDEGEIVIAHGMMEYKISREKLHEDLSYINSKGDCYLRVLHEVRDKKSYTDESIRRFKSFCLEIEDEYKNIKMFCGKNLYNYQTDYEFSNHPSCLELYSSVCPPKWLDDWFPRLYALFNNKKNVEKGTDKDILLIDFVNYA